MNRPLSGERKETLEDGVLQSLCYLHQETLRGNRKELARVIQTAIEQSEHVIPASVPLSRDSNDLLQQFYVLRGFLSLDAIGVWAVTEQKTPVAGRVAKVSPHHDIQW
jgi:hypothetical protein